MRRREGRPRLLLVPTPLDFGIGDGAARRRSRSVVAAGRRDREAAGVAHWVVENARTTRAFLKQVDGRAAGPTAADRDRGAAAPAQGAKGHCRRSDTAADRPCTGVAIGLVSEAGLLAVADWRCARQARPRTRHPGSPLPGAQLLLALAAMA